MPPMGNGEIQPFTPREVPNPQLQNQPQEQVRPNMQFDERPQLTDLAQLGENLDAQVDSRSPYTSSDGQEIIPFEGWFASKLRGAKDYITSIFSHEPRPFDMAQAANEAQRNAAGRVSGMAAERGFGRFSNRLLRQANEGRVPDRAQFADTSISNNLIQASRGFGGISRAALGTLLGVLGNRNTGYNRTAGARA